MGNELLEGLSEVCGGSSGPDLQDMLKKKSAILIIFISIRGMELMNVGVFLSRDCNLAKTGHRAWPKGTVIKPLLDSIVEAWPRKCFSSLSWSRWGL